MAWTGAASIVYFCWRNSRKTREGCKFAVGSRDQHMSSAADRYSKDLIGRREGQILS